jgi:Transposase IS116/IS110/IS902 family
LAVLKAYPHAQAMAKAGVEAVYQVLRGVPSAHFGRPTAKKLVLAAQASSSSSRVLSGRSSSLYILCDQLEHTQANLKRLEEQLEQLISTDPRTKGLRQIPELGPKSVAVLRAELGEVERFARTDQAVAYAGMDVEIKESGKFKGKAKLSKRGSGLLRQILSSFRLAQYSARRLRLRGLLSSSGRARAEVNVRHHGRHAQDGGGSDPSDENGRGLQSQQSLGGDDQLKAPSAGHPHPDRA